MADVVCRSGAGHTFVLGMHQTIMGLLCIGGICLIGNATFCMCTSSMILNWMPSRGTAKVKVKERKSLRLEAFQLMP